MSVVKIDQIGAQSLERVTKILAGISGGAFKAASSALKRAGDTAKTRAGQFAAEEYTIRKSDFMKNVKMKSHIKSEAGGIVSMSILYAGNVLPLLTFHTRYARDGRIQTQVKRTGSAAVLDHVFAAKGKGPVGIYERVGAKRLPIEEKFGPSTAHMMENEDVVKKMDEAIRGTYEKRIEHEITRVLNGWGGR